MIKRIALTLLAIVLVLGVTVAGLGWHFSVDVPDDGTVTGSSQYADGQFRNTEPTAPFEFDLRSLERQFFGTEERVPPAPLPVLALDSQRLASPPGAGLTVVWLGHSSVIVELDGLRVLIDGVLSERASPFEGIGPERFHPPPIALEQLAGIDVAVHSHNHYDHLDRATVLQMARHGTLIFVPLGMAKEVMDWGVPHDQVHAFDWFDERTVKGVRLVATPARHYSGRGLFDYRQTLWVSWTLIGPEHRVFYSGDSGYTRAFAEIGERYGPFDLDIVKVGSYGPGASWRDVHMPVDQAVQAHLDLGGRRLLPVHWATFNLAYHAWDEPIRRAVKSASEHDVSLLTPRLGEVVVVDGSRRDWPRWWETVVAVPGR